MMKLFKQAYKKCILDHPWLVLLSLAVFVGFFASHIPQFRLDASADALVLENDQALKYYRSIKARYGSDDFLIVTYSPQADLFAPETLADLLKLKASLLTIDRVSSVTSLLDLPLINSPPITLDQLGEHVPTLLDESTDRELARIEFTTSPIYKDLVISADAKTTALLVNFERDETWHHLLSARNQLRERALQTPLTPEEKTALKNAEKAFQTHNEILLDKQQVMIDNVRHVLDQHRDKATLYLGGIPMIATDSIDFINSDIRTFGTAIIVFFVLLLLIIFQSIRWVFLPLFTCFCVGLTMVGYLGFVGWPVTVVSSNFISLLLIISLSLTVHLTVRYRECQLKHPKANRSILVNDMVNHMALPCLYTALTTIVAFGSLVVSGIRPIIDFGWMMAIGTGLAFIIAFTFFPTALMLLPACKTPKEHDFTSRITGLFAHVIQHFRGATLLTFTVLAILSIWGVSRLSVENRFIDYYKKDTEIYQGMEVIDHQLGGTTPLEIIINAHIEDTVVEEEDDLYGDEEDFYSDEDDLYNDSDSSLAIAKGYWFSALRFDEIARIHNYLDSLPQIGKVLSFHTTAETLKDLDETATEPLLQTVLLAALYRKAPDIVKETLFTPFISEDGNQLRFSTRVYESDKSLQREVLIQQIRDHLIHELGYRDDQIHITGMLVLYNNMLQSLFKSQILTIGFVFIAILCMFIFSFRNLRMAILALIPNMLAATVVLSIMGWLNIPLDIMTITIAAISIGIAVDGAIHYVHRFKEEYQKDGHTWPAIKRSHQSIGRAIYYTSITIILGFSILAFSNFVPTIYFGLLTAFCMFIALVANLTLLPLLIVLFKPLPKQRL